MSGIMSMLLGAVSSVAVAVDEFFNRVTLLLPGNGTNGAQNNTFLDSSTNNFTITRNGNTTQGTFSPFSQTGWSNYFDGTGDYLSIANNAALNVGSGDFCIEAWFNVSSVASQQIIVSNAGASGSDNTQIDIASGNIRFASSATVWLTGNAVTTNVWNHVVVSRSGTTMSLFLNGSRQATATNSTNFANANNYATIVGGYPPSTALFTGYISNVRIVKGSSVYDPTQTTLIVPTAHLTAITNTSLLTCQSNRFIDNSSNAFTITRNGDVSVQAFSPFAPTAAYSAATVGGSGYFDASGDYLSVAGSSLFAFGTGDFTLEVWINPNAISTATFDRVCATSDYNGSGFDWALNTGASALFLAGSSYGFSVNTKAWNHLVYTRSGTTLRGFLNGRLASYNTGVSQNITSTSTLLIGAGYSGSLYNGYMTGLRIIKGSIPTEYQTSSTITGTQIFTTPTAPPTTTSQGATANDVELLLNYTNAGITDATAKNVLETVGNAQISTTQSKFGGSSMYFDGTGDQLVFPNSENFNIIRGNFTVECWVYLTGSSGSIVNYTNGQTNNTNFAFELYQISSSTIYMSIFEGSTQYLASSTAFALNTWVHLAGVRNGNTLTVYVNGTAGSTTANVTGVVGNNPGSSTLKVSGYNNATNMITGYVDDLRITKGLARYTANFTAPTTAFPLQ